MIPWIPPWWFLEWWFEGVQGAVPRLLVACFHKKILSPPCPSQIGGRLLEMLTEPCVELVAIIICHLGFFHLLKPPQNNKNPSSDRFPCQTNRGKQKTFLSKWKVCKAVPRIPYIRGIQPCLQNCLPVGIWLGQTNASKWGTLANGAKEQNLRNPSCMLFDPHPFPKGERRSSWC